MFTGPEEILNFWFVEIGPARWFKEDRSLDEEVRSNFLEAHEAVLRGDLKKWEETPEGVLALLLLLDQFPRLIFRGTPRAYATDEMALELARTSIIKHFDDRIDRSFKLFFYLPFEHSERAGDQRLAVFYVHERTKNPEWTEIAEKRAAIIQRFGRFPHLNAMLGRESTPEEKEYIEKSTSGFKDLQS